MQYLLTKEELDKLKGTVTAEDRAAIAEEVITEFMQEISPTFKPDNRAYGLAGYQENDTYRISLERVRGIFSRVREKFKVKQ